MEIHFKPEVTDWVYLNKFKFSRIKNAESKAKFNLITEKF